MTVEAQTPESFPKNSEISAQQALIFQGKICPYCNGETVYVDSVAVYSKSFGMIYLCRPCNAYVGVHQGTSNAKGRLADEELRHWKKKAHANFDPIWKEKLNLGEAKHIVRNRAYKWLSEEMNLHRELTHIGFMDVEQCKLLIEICKKINPFDDVEEDLQIEKKLQENSKIISTQPPSLDLQKEKYLQVKKNVIDSQSYLLPAREERYEKFEEIWFQKFKAQLGEDIWYDQKKYCYTFNLLNPSDEPVIVDFYPKADKALIRQENRWIKPGLDWLVQNLLPGRHRRSDR